MISLLVPMGAIACFYVSLVIRNELMIFLVMASWGRVSRANFYHFGILQGGAKFGKLRSEVCLL